MRIERGTKRLVRPREGEKGSSAREWVALSSADFMVPPVHVELLLAYEAAPPTSALEEGLRTVLGEYSEWAGRILPAHPEAGRPVILLNNAGVAFTEAQAQGPLDEMLPFEPSLLLRDLIPPHFGASELLFVQVTRFTCGGMTMGIAWHHQVADGEAAIDFMKAWAFRLQGLPMPFSSSQDRSILIGRNPPQPICDHIEFKRPLRSKINTLPSTSEKQEVIVRKLHFSAELLKEIKQEATKEGEEFTRFESLMGHLWRCITRARGLEKDDGGEEEEDARETRLMVAVNARKRMESMIGKKGYFGNVVCPTCASSNIKQLTREPLRYAAGLVKEAIKKVGESFVRSSLDYVELKDRHPFEGGRMDGSVLTPNLSVTSWATLPLYQLDFGFGFPFFAGNAFIPFEGLLIILPPPLPDGSLHVVLGLFASAMDKVLSTYQSIL